ncbi:MAG: ammonia-forming cytochrome c nitrite reductase subunit c552 [Acidobacteria bacterium]|nr:ammonia-forming cytochrome c nitrite reductase subunit c552 [Acidobacteriota bacterium]
MKVLWITATAAIVVAAVAPAAQQAAAPDPCITCHRRQSPGIYEQWKGSKHAAAGIGCLDCHQADPADADAFLHHGATIATLVTPKDCGGCHEQEAEQVRHSYHATAGKILDSQDAYLAHVAGGAPVAIQGCESCHGTKVVVDPSSPDKLSKKSWPNSGIGRINPDCSLGSCTACHTRHAFSTAQARQPEACSKCHLGPDHPQKEIYEESKHGNAFFTNIAKMNLDSDSWVVGVDYSAAPTCATCHMGATRTEASTHDVGERIAWTLRPPISRYKPDHERKRANMKNVCSSCHEKPFVDGHFYQFDATVRLYNEKFAEPATHIMDMIRKKGLLEHKAAFSNPIEWTYWELWHHEGRRARHGAAMMGPDYTWWHGFYEVAQHFYFKFLPEARAYNDPEVDAYIDQLLTKNPMHDWIDKDTAQLKQEIRSGEMQKTYDGMFKEE